MYFRRFLSVHMGAAAFLVAVASSVHAQTPSSPSSVHHAAGIATALPALRSVTPDLPPIQPILPEASEIHLVLKISERRVYVYNGETLMKSYPVAVGRPGWETPTGSFKVLNMIEHPGWTNPLTGAQMPPGPDNPLGERWIAFWTDGTNSIGFHGTPNPESVGRAASHGCVRMFNQNVRELYSLVQVGTPVTVEP